MADKSAGESPVLSDQLGRLEVAAYDLTSSVQIVARRQRDGSRLWAVQDTCGSVLNKLGQWECEPMPSSRDDDFLARCRFASPLEARDAFKRHLLKA